MNWYRREVTRNIGWIWIAALGAACAGCSGAEPAWTLVRNEHFEIYSQADVAKTRAALVWFEQLRKFFEQSGFELDGHRPLRVIAFSSAREYDTYRLPPNSDAYYVGTEKRDYIVMPSLGAAEFPMAAHEYTHAQLRAAGLKLPSWLNEGLAEVFSTLRIAERECYLGGELPAHVAILRHNPWMPLDELFASTPASAAQKGRRTEALFYAESWALTEMLALSPNYGPKFREVVASAGSEASSARTLRSIYPKSLDEIMADLHAWIDERKFKPVRLAGVETGSVAAEVHTVSSFESDFVLADLSLSDGELNRAEALYRKLALEAPEDAQVWGALGSIALRKGNRELARQNWKRAINAGIRDPHLCYSYAVLADDAGLNADEVRLALRRAIELDPDFDDAHYKLGLLENNTGRHAEAILEFEAMHDVPAERGFGYWSAVAYAYEELGRRDEAQDAAQKALAHAHTAEEREHARELAYMASTDFGVRFTRDANGEPQLVTTRVPHDARAWNPFIEPSDRVVHIDGKLRTIDCTAGKATGVVIETPQQTVRLTIADAMRVEMRNAPAEFACGAQTGKVVVAEFAASVDSSAGTAGILRGLEFR